MAAMSVALSNWIAAAGDRGQVSIRLDVKLDEGNVFAPDISWCGSMLGSPQLPRFKLALDELLEAGPAQGSAG